MIKAIIFDLDGTLCDTMPDLRTAMNAMLARLGYKTRSRADLIRFINNGAREFVRRSLPKEVQRVEFIIDSALGVYETEYAKCYCEKTKAYDGIKAMLMELKGRGYKLAVLSNKQDKFVKDIIDTVFGKGLFNIVQGQSNLPTKPNPESSLAIARALGAKPDKCLFLGDSDVDMETAKNAGMLSIGCAWGYREAEVLLGAGAERIAENPDAIVPLVDEIEGELARMREEARLAKKRK
ncbi:MAG: HAD family hydrolase [Clostridia bacterium]|nr:HAD family hydrolase [Clostridia bacterium]